MDFQDVLLTCVITTLPIILSFIYYWIKNSDVLPGPIGLPYLGLYPILSDQNAHLKLEAYKQKYGDIFSFTFTGRLFINLGSSKAIRDVHVNKSEYFTERFKDSNILTEMLGSGRLFINVDTSKAIREVHVNKSEYFTERFKDPNILTEMLGLTFVNGEPWKVFRKFFVQKFREYGFNTVRDDMAGPVYDTLNATVEDLRNAKEKPVNIINLLSRRCTVTMRKILFGEDGVSDDELEKMIVAYSGVLDGVTGVKQLIIGPLARLMFRTPSVLKKSLTQHKFLYSLIFKCAKKMQKDMDYDNPTCIIEEFYREKKERLSNNDPTWRYFTDKALVESVLQFVGDGIVSVAALIASLLNALLEHPMEQGKLYSEIMDVVGPSRDPVAEDRNSLPYTNAFINECLRSTNFILFFPSLECTKETVIRGYRIPKGSITLYNFYSSHRDPETYKDPEKFDPSRFLQSPGKPKVELPVAFGLGKRSCSGEPFVMLQCFLFLTNIVKNFKISSSSAPSKSTIDILLSGQLELIFCPRNES